MGRQKDKFLVLDVETANDVKEALCYDIGFAICDRQGNVEYQKSYIISDIFFDEKNIFKNKELMNSAYYHEKLPQYFAGIKSGEWQVKSFLGIRKEIKELIKKYKIKAVCAYNSAFDINALNQTLRYITKSNLRWFFNYDMQVYCIWHMACQTVCKSKDYIQFAYENKKYSEAGNMQTSAEIVWQYLTKDYNFEEKHTGLEDVKIECQIMAKCLNYHKKINRKINRACWCIPQKQFKNYKIKKEAENLPI